MAEKADELKIEEKGGGTEAERGPEEERVTPDVEADFLGLLKDYGVAEKAAKVITKHVAETGTADVFEDPKQLLEKMAKFPRHIPPVTRKNILDHWTASRDIPIPEGFEEEAELPAEELKARKGKGTAPEKYSVDTETGAIKVASTTDKTALTWDEAEKLSKEIKKDLEEARKRQEAEGGGKEPAFILGEQGAWTLNPKAKIGFGEFAVFQMYQDSLKKGEPIDPVEELTRREEQSVRLKEAMGVKGEDSEMTTLDKLDKLGMLQKPGEGGEGALLSQLDSLGLLRKPGEEGRATQIDMLDKLNQLGMLQKTGEGGEGALLSQLDSLGLLRKPGEEGRATQIDMLDKLNQLGLLKKTGEGEAGSQTITALQTEVKELKESLQKQEMDTVKNAVISLSNQLSELRKDMSSQGKLEGRFALMDKTIATVDSQLTGIRSDAKPFLASLAGGGGGEPSKKSPEEKARIAKELKGAVVLEKEAKDLEDELLFGGIPQS